MRKEEDQEENTQNIRRTLKMHISAMAKQIRMKFGMECAIPEGRSTTKWCSYDQALLSYNV